MRDSTENIYSLKINQVIDYISANLHQSLQLDVIADKINVSQRQLLRIMRSVLNEPLSMYIARQRIERAVLYMQTEKMNLTKLATMVGYDNPQSFSKAFKRQMGISPKTYMDELQNRLECSVRGNGNRNQDVSFEICQFEGMELVYIRIIGKYGEDISYKATWNKLTGFLRKNEALSKETRFIGLSFDDPHVTQPDRCRFYACASVSKKISPTGEFGTIQLREGRYAVYTLVGSYSELQELYNHISVRSEYTLRYGMAFEEYVGSSTKNTDEQITKIYIPIE